MEATSETLVHIQELVRKTTERLETDFSRIGTKIHRFPRGLKGVGGKGGRYIIPSFVALGPYHHGSPQLQEMEEVKHAAAHYFCAESGHSVEEMYDKILSIIGQVRCCYAEDAIAGFSNAEFAAMMFLDGCFLLRYITFDMLCALLTNRMTLSTGPCMLRDIFLLENQLPWLVLEALMAFTNNIVPVYRFVYNLSFDFEAISVSDLRVRLSEDEFQRYRPPHLLGLFRYYQIGAMPPEDPSYKRRCRALASGATELSEIGVKLTASDKRWFADMSIRKGPLAGALSLTPLFLSDCTACWLVNMAAFEACTSTSYPSDGFVVSSYLSLLAMLMDKEEDVHQLRAKHLLRSFFSNQEVLGFFKGLTRHMRLGRRYYSILEEVEHYRRERPVRIAVHKFLYRNFKTIAAVLSIAGVLVGIFKTLLSLKEHPQ
ncbi:UPF0481 protein At3g47200-like [Triticum urartu]|uniref:Uncharacterized protein n=1 Tax=Triticum urartu TaxID=4572 RepID=A0A8R7R9G0_TRIUA|nr:UPF0481 protein At3g47200-like [Triticum urartu]